MSPEKRENLQEQEMRAETAENTETENSMKEAENTADVSGWEKWCKVVQLSDLAEMNEFLD